MPDCMLRTQCCCLLFVNYFAAKMVDLTYDNLTILIKKLQTLRANITSLYFDLESGFINERLEESASNQQNINFNSIFKRKLGKIGQAYL